MHIRRIGSLLLLAGVGLLLPACGLFGSEDEEAPSDLQPMPAIPVPQPRIYHTYAPDSDTSEPAPPPAESEERRQNARVILPSIASRKPAGTDQESRPAGSGNDPENVAELSNGEGHALQVTFNDESAQLAEFLALETYVELKEREFRREPGPELARELQFLMAALEKWEEAEGYAVYAGDPEETVEVMLRAAILHAVGEHQAAQQQVRSVASRLRGQYPLRLPVIRFCRQVVAYGNYVAMEEPYRLRAGEPFILYFEVENFTCHRQSSGSHRVSLQVSYELIDLNLEEDEAPSLQTSSTLGIPNRSEYEQSYHTEIRDLGLMDSRLRAPTNVASGRYRLRITVEDRIGDKKEQAHLDFQILN